MQTEAEEISRKLLERLENCDLCYVVIKHLVKLSPKLTWKIENVLNEPEPQAKRQQSRSSQLGTGCSHLQMI